MRLSWSIGVLTALCWCTAPSVQAAIRTAPYRIATVAWAGWSPLHVAAAMGFWDSVGVGVQVANYDDPAVILEAMKAGHIDLAMDMVGSVVGIHMADRPVAVLAETDWSDGGDRLIVRAGTDISQHCGQPLGVFLKLPSCLYFLGRYLEPRGLALTDFRIVELKPEDLTDQFIAGRIPTIVNYDPHALRALEQGDGRLLATSADFPGCIPECIWTYREQLAGMDSTAVVAVLRGWILAAEWVNQPRNWPQYQRILNAATFAGLQPYTEAQLRELVAAVRIHDRPGLVERNQRGGGLDQYLTDLRAYLEGNGLLTQRFQTREIYDSWFITRALTAP